MNSPNTSTNIFPPPYASLSRRFIAMLLDGFIVSIFLGVLAVLLHVPFLTYEHSPINGMGAVLHILYMGFSLASKHQATYGKRLVGIYVVGTDGQPLTLGRALWRGFGFYVSGIGLAFGFLLALFTAKKQTLHDFMADSVVLLHPNRLPPPTDQDPNPIINRS